MPPQLQKQPSLAQSQAKSSFSFPKDLLEPVGLLKDKGLHKQTMNFELFSLDQENRITSEKDDISVLYLNSVSYILK